MSILTIIFMVLSMAIITYLIRMLPLVFLRKKINSKFICSLLYYIPYAVLSSMTFPAIFYITNNIYASLIGTGVALICALFKRPLIFVAICACLATLLALLIL